MKLNKKEREQINKAMEITFMHIRDIIENPGKLDDIPDGAQFFPVYLKEKGKKAALLGIKPTVA